MNHIKNQKGAINTVEILGWVAVVSIVLVAVVASLKPSIIGTDSFKIPPAVILLLVFIYRYTKLKG